MTNQERNDLQDIITQALNDMKTEQGMSFNLEKVNLAELERRTGLSRKKLRRIKSDGFRVLPDKRLGTHKGCSILSGYNGTVDDFLKRGVTNSEVIYHELKQHGYAGGRTTLKDYIHAHRYLVPAERALVAPQGDRGRRYTTDPGECIQMDWGFSKVVENDDYEFRAACLAMICHCCGDRYIELFPNATQESLFIGMLHGFEYLGIPKYILTDNMKSVINGRDINGNPIWNHDYEDFMKAVGFETKVCKARHPFTKGKVERLIRFVKENFIQGRVFGDLTDLNYEAIRWCNECNNTYYKCVDCTPAEKHAKECAPNMKSLVMNSALMQYLYPERKVSFDGFVSYEGRRFGVPMWYKQKVCRVSRQDYTLYIYSMDCSETLATHAVTWSRRDSYCKDQYVEKQPEETPTAPVTTVMYQSESCNKAPMSEFNFDKEVEW